MTTSLTDSRYFEPEIETMPRDQLRALQADRLLPLLERAATHAPLYQELWKEAKVTAAGIAGIDDFTAAIPFIDKERLRSYRAATGDAYSGLLCVPERELTRVGFGSGTTGEPIYFPERYGVRPYISQFTARDIWEMGLRPGEFMTWMGSTYRAPWYTCAHAVGAMPLFCDHNPGELEPMIELSRQFAPTLLYSLSSPLVMGLERLADSYDLTEAFASYRATIFAGEKLSPRKREVLASWGFTEVFDMSAAGDMLSVFDCREHAGFHLWEDAVLAEVIDPETLEPVADGETGELVVTALVNDVAPFIRYRSDDLVRWTSERCGCGRTHGRFEAIGRASDQVIIDGRSILPAEITGLLERLPATSAGLFQVIRPQRELSRLAIRVGYAQAAGRNTALVRDEVHGLLETELGVAVDVDLISNDQLLVLGPPHKIPRVAKQ
jgi:phenylacetate-CoA ligase